MLFYAASVFVSNLVGAAVVAFTLAVNLTRGDPVVSIAAEAEHEDDTVQ
ncbi:hypothetical protein [Amycolatopsis lexingtonensis]